MRIFVVHNPKAGSEEHQGEDLIKALKRAGHKAIYQSSKKKGITKALKKKKKIDLVLVAGGDGTLSKVACRLVALKSKVPLSVLPLGTANNFARTLGFCLSQKELVERLSYGQCDSFDVGVARGPWGKRYFFEGAGAGLFADYVKGPRKDGEEAKSKAEEMRFHVNALRRRLQSYRACRWKIELDGEDLSGRYLLWHAMNIRSVGPVLALAAGAKTNDGLLDFVGARDKDRKVLLDYLKARASGKRSRFPVSRKRFTRMRLRWTKAPLHFDDEHWPNDDKKRPRHCDIEIVVNDSALKIWQVG